MTAALLQAPPAPQPTSASPLRQPEPVLRVLARRAAETPGQVAVDDGGYHVTYAELWHAATRTRRDLVEAGAQPGDVVAIAAGRGAPLIAAMLGVWLAGAACLPVGAGHLDLSVPDLAEIRAAVVAPGFPAPDGVPAVRIVEIVPAALTEPPWVAIPDGASAAFLSVVSGSSGRPVTIGLTHDDLAVLLERCTGDTRLAAGPVVLEFFRPLVLGDRLRLAPGRPSE
jgi:non-ribosomal peptide synthetase component F